MKLNGQSKMFARVLAMGYHLQCTHKYTYLRRCSVDNILKRLAQLKAISPLITYWYSLLHIITGYRVVISSDN